MLHIFKQNIHLVVKWLGTLEKLLERLSKGSHSDYRVFISAEPAPTPEEHIIPQGILENSIKIINEPPTGMLANLHAALYNFDQVSIRCAVTYFFFTLNFTLTLLSTTHKQAHTTHAYRKLSTPGSNIMGQIAHSGIS